MSDSELPLNNRRLSKRKQPRKRLRVACYRGPWELGQNLGLSVLDLSETGVRMVVKEEIKVGQEVAVNLEGTTNARPVKRTGKVVWSLPLAEVNYCVGICFHKRIDYGDFLNLT